MIVAVRRRKSGNFSIIVKSRWFSIIDDAVCTCVGFGGNSAFFFEILEIFRSAGIRAAIDVDCVLQMVALTFNFFEFLDFFVASISFEFDSYTAVF
jgi:hypothetical protein